MKKNEILIVLMFLLSFLVSASLIAQNDSPSGIKGTIIDGSSGDILFGANIIVDGTSLGSASDLNGEYYIRNIPPGIYSIVYKYLGYKQQVMTEVQLLPGRTTEINVTLQPEVIEGEVVVISAQAKGQLDAINQQLSSNSMKNIVSSDRIKEVPDVNAAESIGRLPGVSLKRSGGEGNKVVVRGLSPQYSIIEVDGVRLTGVDLDRSVGLSTISSDMLDGIELSKTLTADRDADAIGGIVNLRTRVAKEGLHFDILSQGGYNNLETSLNNYKFAGSISNRFFENKLGLLFNLNTERVNRSSDRFNAGYGSRKETDVNDITKQVINLYTDNANIIENISLRERQGGSLVLDYKTDFMNIKINNFYLQMKNDNESRNNQFRFSNNDFRLLATTGEPDESIQSHSLSSIFNLFDTELNIDFSYSKTKLDNFTDEYEFQDNTVVNGNGSFPDGERKFADPSNLIINRYDISSIRSAMLHTNTRDVIKRNDETKTINLDWKVPYAFGADISGDVKVGFKYTQKDRSSDTETIWSYYFGGIGADRRDRIYANNPDFLKAGDIPEYFYSVVGLPALNFLDPDYDYGKILDGRYKQLGWSPDFDILKRVHNYDLYPENQIYKKGVESNVDDYVNTEERTAGYIMSEINIGSKIMIEPGVRYEFMHTDYSSEYVVSNEFATDGLEAGYPINMKVDDRDNEYFFPSINTKFTVNEWSSIRAAYYKSASRPDYRLLSPGLISDNLRQNITAYNPYLRPAIAHNFDLGVTIFNNELGFLTINGFYKEITDLIYRLPRYQPSRFDEVTGAPEELLESLRRPRELYADNLYTKVTEMNGFPINNPNKTYFSGFEINWQTQFWYLPGLLNGLVLDVNYSYIDSRAQFPYLLVKQTGVSPGFPPIPIYETTYHTKKSRMLDQPRHLVNVRIGWDYKDFSSRLSFRYQGETVRSLDPVLNITDSFIGDEFRMDFTAKQKVMENFSVILDLSNITEVIEDAQLKSHNLIASSEFYGFTSQFGIRYEF